AIWRPERINCAFRSSEKTCVRRIQIPYPQSLLPFSDNGVGDVQSIRRNSRMAARIETRLFRKQHGEPEHAGLFREVAIRYKAERYKSQCSNSPRNGSSPDRLGSSRLNGRGPWRRCDCFDLSPQVAGGLPSPLRVFLKTALQ